MRGLRPAVFALVVAGVLAVPTTAGSAPPPRINVTLTADGCTLDASASWSNVNGTYAFIDFVARGRSEPHIYNWRVVANVSGSTATASATFQPTADGSVSQFWARVYVFDGEPNSTWSNSWARRRPDGCGSPARAPTTRT